MAKFKVGDRVIVPKTIKCPDAFKEKTGVINGFRGYGYEVKFDNEISHVRYTTREWGAEEQEIEFEHLYKSPLMKALS